MTTTRPDFDEAPEFDESRQHAPLASRSITLAWLRLMRLPNVFTAIADVAMGYLVTHGSFVPPAKLACLIVASACLYTAGMVLNDVFDIAVDAKERPFRPLPSGQIGLATARAFGFTLLLVGVACGWAAGVVDPGNVALPWRSGAIATTLAVAVVLYNAWLKRTPVGPFGMGLCRFLNVLLGMSVAPQLLGDALALGYTPGELLVAGGIGVYIAGVTWLAKNEAGESRALAIGTAVGVMLSGAVVLGAGIGKLPAFGNGQQVQYVWMLLVLLMITVLRRALSAVSDPSSSRVQAAVKHSILSLIWLDAATSLVAAPPQYAICIAALLVPAMLLGRWVYST